MMALPGPDATGHLLAAAFAIAVSVHNFEEARFLVPWLRRRPRHSLRLFSFAPDGRVYWVMTTLVSVVVAGVAIAFWIWPQSRNVLFALSGCAIAMSLNAVVPHLAWTLWTRSYAPGTGSGLLLNLPLGSSFVGWEMSSGALSPYDILFRATPYALALAIFAFGGLYVGHAVRR